MDWQAPAIILEMRPFGEHDAIATLLTEAEGRRRGLVRGGQGRRQAALWQSGNLIAARWQGRLAEQLGHFTAEPIRVAAALVLDDPLRLALLSAICATIAGALPEQAPHPRVFAALWRLIEGVSGPETAAAGLAELVRFEAGLLAELGYGLDLSSCALTGVGEDLAFVSPRSGRAVSRAAAGPWRGRLLCLPAFLCDPEAAIDAEALAAGLRLTGHFLAREVFGARHQPLPAARQALYERVLRLAEPGLSHEGERREESPCPKS
jgi:DNA repair protein RecO (recombination protein O)